jgi:hypothetical protein
VFEQDSLFEASIQLRKWDELAKEIETPLIDLEIIKAKATSALASTFRN